jgi:hypothetical protein
MAVKLIDIEIEGQKKKVEERALAKSDLLVCTADLNKKNNMAKRAADRERKFQEENDNKIASFTNLIGSG